MKSLKLKIKNKLGIHARPASMIVDAAMKHSGNIKLIANGIVADAKSILSIMMLAAECGTEIEITAENNSDDDKAADDIKNLFERKFDED
ncbi:MAG: HPr family phosphocarrier protein [Candidatus Muirbacterium halophilum]|nr:HPr family phosphocarrier protein [Candidatus Muirbacterium halophilum]MCK9477148.1 HPr family phosphocarrier protein [Candidatus Muirbacterium halophilum]